jgi:hypothetical protein
MDSLHHTYLAFSALLIFLAGVSSVLRRLAASSFRSIGLPPLAVALFTWLHPLFGTLYLLTSSSRHRCLSFAPS